MVDVNVAMDLLLFQDHALNVLLGQFIILYYKIVYRLVQEIEKY
jgi:hypothetical protein